MECGQARIGLVTLLAGTLVLLGGCATTETKVSCDGRLQPINSQSGAMGMAAQEKTERASQGATP